MLQKSKLSNRFIKNDNTDAIVDRPIKFTFSKSNETLLDSDVEEEKSTNEITDSNCDANEQISNINYEVELKKALLEKIDTIPVWSEYPPGRQRDLIKSFLDNRLTTDCKNLSDSEKEDLIEKLFSSIMGFGPLDYLISQDNVDTVFVNGTNSVHIEINGKILNTEMKLSTKQLSLILNNISVMSGVRIDKSKNIWNCCFNNLSITVIMPNISQAGYNITIRKIIVFDSDQLIENNMLSKEIFDFIVLMVRSKKNIVISGDINSGKTSFLDVLIKSVLEDKRSILLENTPFISTDFNTLMKFLIDIHSDDYDELLSNVLKMAPDYILSDLNIAIPQLSDIKGNIFTLRASSVENAMSKLINSVISKENISEKLAKTKILTDYDYIIQINRMSDGVRRVTSIVELTPARTSAMSVKTIVKYENGGYINFMPQPLISMQAGSLFSEAGSMSSRFYHSH